ncbi:hypothetical protein Ga0061065_1077 [Marinomonas fungiae]|uniref:Flp pilus assembly protein, pilin Flp n=1 Tax=Marinomonas fungiae TaxID=1137284 RepID=A0A0K6IMT8_9GAMM|nr:hypothetical protein Ga0061065_1077 [Marinomonas fungiae]
MIMGLYRKLVAASISFTICRKGVTAIEYAVVSVTIVAIVAAVFNPSTGPLYDAMIAAKNAIIAALENNT